MVGAHLLVILVLQVLGTVRNGKSLQEREKEKQQPEAVQFRWKNLGNFIAIVTLTVDFVQMWTWPLQDLKQLHEQSHDAAETIVGKAVPYLFIQLNASRTSIYLNIDILIRSS